MKPFYCTKRVSDNRNFPWKLFISYSPSTWVSWSGARGIFFLLTSFAHTSGLDPAERVATDDRRRRSGDTSVRKRRGGAYGHAIQPSSRHSHSPPSFPCFYSPSLSLSLVFFRVGVGVCVFWGPTSYGWISTTGPSLSLSLFLCVAVVLITDPS